MSICFLRPPWGGNTHLVRFIRSRIHKTMTYYSHFFIMIGPHRQFYNHIHSKFQNNEWKMKSPCRYGALFKSGYWHCVYVHLRSSFMKMYTNFSPWVKIDILMEVWPRDLYWHDRYLNVLFKKSLKEIASYPKVRAYGRSAVPPWSWERHQTCPCSQTT